MANSPSIVMASLSDDKLKKSIDSLVAHVDEAMKKMVQSTNNAVGEMEAKLKSLGNLKIDSGGSADGGASKRAKAQNAETDAVEKTITARGKQIKQNQETAMSFDQIAAAQQKAIQSQGDPILKKSFNKQELQQYIDRLRELQAEYIKVNTQQGGGVKSDKIKADMRNLEEIIAKYKEILKNLDYVNSRQGTIDVKKWVQDLGAVDDRYKKLVRWYTVLEKEDQRRIASEEKANQKRIADLEKEKAAQDKVVKSYQDSVLKAEVGRIIKTMPTSNIDEVRAKFERLSTIIANIRELGILSPEKISAADSEVKKLSASIQRYEKFEQERIAAEQKFIIEQAKEVEQTQTLEGRVKGLAQAAREYMKANSDNRWSTSAYSKDLTIYAEGDVRARGLSIEEQITRQLQTEKEMILAQVDGAKKLNEERKKTTTEGYDIYGATRAKIASKLGIKQDEVINADASTDSIKRVSSALKQLQDAYAKMDASERKSPVGQHMIRQMQELERQTKQLRSQMSRPISLKDAMGLSEKTLDDIAYKMQRLRAYKQGIDLTKPNAAYEINQVDEALAKLQKDADKWMSKSQEMIKNNTALGRSWNYMKNRLAFYFTVGASTQFVKNLIDIRSQYELLERSIGILIDSAQNGSQIFAELNSMAIKSPFTTMELGAAAKQLVAYDVAAKDVVDTTRRLADMAAAVGIPIERLTYALGQIKAYGYLNARDARMFANAGIPLVKELADRYTELEGRLVSTADVYDRIKKKAISYEDVMATVNKMTDEGGKFFNFQEKAADTLKVRIANLTLAWNNMMNEMGAANQGVLSSGLKTLSDVFKNWRSIYNLITSIIVTFGVLKATQVVVLTNMAMHIKKNITLWAALEFAMRKSIGAAVVNYLRSIGSLLARLSNPLSIATAVVTALGVAIGKAVLDYKDLIAANEAFNKSISDNAKENIGSIEKFFEDYKKQLSNIGGLNNADQEKLWERIQEEIEKTTKNAEDYIRVLNNVEDVSSRIHLGENVLEQSKTIQREIQRLADYGTFSIGGGFANDSAAQNLQNYQEALNEIRQEYGSVNAAIEAHTMKSRKLMADYTTQRNEVRAELNDFVSKLDNAYMPEILGQSDDVRIQMANVRSFAESLRDAFIATEEGSKIGADGIVLLNNAIDKWITKQGVANNLIVNANGYFDEQRAKIEENKTAWEEFFRYISKKDREYLDAAIKTNNIGSDEVKKIWDEAAKEMSKRATTSYDLIQDQIAQLRNTPDIVINVVYRNEKEKLDKDQEEFEKKYIQPKDWGVLSTDEYIKQEKANREKYGTLMRKQGEDTVEYEKRISDERKTNLELQKRNGDIIEENKNKTDAYSQSVTKQAEKEKKAADDRLKAIKEIEDASGYDFSTKSENAAARKAASKAESELAKALKDELSTIDKVRSIYKDLTKEGMSHANAVERATRGWGETVNAINKVLQKNGLQKLDLSKFAGIENPRELVNMLQSQLNTLLKRGAKPAEIKELQTKIQTLNVDADKYDLTKITKGLNNELGKLKDEYELAVEFDANPEMGNMFTQMFGLDTTDFPRTIGDYMQRVQNEFDKARMNLNLGTSLNVFKANTEQWYKWGEAVGYSKEQVDDFKKSFDGSVAVAKKWAQDVVKQTQDLQYKLADNNGKIAIEEEKLAVLRQRLAQETNDKQKALLELQIQDQENAIAKLKEELLQLLPTYQRVFGEVAEHSAWMTRKLAKDYKNMLVEGKNRGLNADNTYSVRDPLSGQISRISKERMGKEIKNADKELQKSQSTIKKITESFTKGEDEVVDWVHGVELIGEELEKLGQFVDVVGQIADAFGNPDEYNATAEAIHDISTSLQGASTVAQGIQQFASGDYIGGATSILSGVFTTVSAWMDNSDKKIQQSIKDSERAVSRLELAYIDLEHAVNEAYGMATIGANMAAKANKELQLIELKRQLALERSRDSKNRDEDKITDLQKQIKELEYDIQDTVDSIVNDLLGVSSVGDAMENMMDAFIEALRSGEDAMATFDESVDEMIANMVKKMFTTKILQPWFEEQWSKIQEQINERAGRLPDELAKVQSSVSNARMADVSNNDSLVDALRALGFSEEEIHRLNWYNEYGQYDRGEGRNARLRAAYEKALKEAEKKEAEIQQELTNATLPTTDDIRRYAELLRSGQPIMEENMQEVANFLRELGLMKDDANKSLSALQQGIQGITEDTAGALEAYMNGVSQQVYLHSDLLTQIRDAVVGMDMDVQVATQAQMLLQLQQSYAVQMAIQGILEGWNNPSGQAVRVELVS